MRPEVTGTLFTFLFSFSGELLTLAARRKRLSKQRQSVRLNVRRAKLALDQFWRDTGRVEEEFFADDWWSFVVFITLGRDRKLTLRATDSRNDGKDEAQVPITMCGRCFIVDHGSRGTLRARTTEDMRLLFSFMLNVVACWSVWFWAFERKTKANLRSPFWFARHKAASQSLIGKAYVRICVLEEVPSYSGDRKCRKRNESERRRKELSGGDSIWCTENKRY